MGVDPPYLFEPQPGSISVECDVDGAVTVLAVRGTWNRRLWRETSIVLRKCLAQHPAALIVDLTALDDQAATSAPTWLVAQGAAAGMAPPVRMALCISPDLTLADRLQRLGARRFLPVFAKVRQARVAVEGRLPLSERLLLSLAAEPESPASARDLVGRACQAWDLPTLRRPAQLIVSELVTNAVEHAGTAIKIVVARRGTGLHLAAADADHRLPQLRPPAVPRPGQPFDERGRGLRIVHATATVWGAMPTADGKVVWATIRPGRFTATGYAAVPPGMPAPMTTDRPPDEPNDEGFAGDPTTPEPRPARSDHDVDGEDIAVPAGDLTAPLMETLEQVGSKDDRDDDS
jgi:anti-sigma regulatory factor (Ser/Thr protein kinase)